LLFNKKCSQLVFKLFTLCLKFFLLEFDLVLLPDGGPELSTCLAVAAEDRFIKTVGTKVINSLENFFLLKILLVEVK